MQVPGEIDGGPDIRVECVTGKFLYRHDGRHRRFTQRIQEFVDFTVQVGKRRYLTDQAISTSSVE